MGLCPLLPNVSDLTHLRSQTSIQFPKSKEEIELLKALWVMTITDQRWRNSPCQVVSTSLPCEQSGPIKDVESLRGT